MKRGLYKSLRHRKHLPLKVKGKMSCSYTRETCVKNDALRYSTICRLDIKKDNDKMTCR